MHGWQSLSDVRREYRYHVEIIPKRRQNAFLRKRAAGDRPDSARRVPYANRRLRAGTRSEQVRRQHGDAIPPALTTVYDWYAI